MLTQPISEGNFIDNIEIDAASNTGVEDVRKLRDGIRYAPLEGKAKIYIIDEVHMLSNQAFNALLKTLEEPPSHAYFCLATTEIQKVPSTIISRCQRFDFRRVSAAELRNHLEHICEVDSISCDTDALDIIARRADGSVRDSLSILDQVIAFTNGSVKRDEVIGIIGEVRHDLYFRAVNLAFSGDAAQALQLDEDLALVGTDPQDFVSGLQSYLVQIISVKSLGIDKADVPFEARDEFIQTSQRLSEADLVRILSLCSSAEVDIKQKFNPRIRLQLLLIRMAMFERSIVLRELIEQVGENKSTVSIKPPVSQRPNMKLTINDEIDTEPTLTPNTESKEKHNSSSKVDSGRGEEVLKNAQSSWNMICDKVSQEYNSRGQMLKYGAYPVELRSGILKINCNSPTVLEAARTGLHIIKRELTSLVGEIRLELAQGPLPSNHFENEVDPMIRMLEDQLGAQQIS